MLPPLLPAPHSHIVRGVGARRIFPFIGHTGITDSKGIICDFQGPYFVGTEGTMAFGNPTRYIQLDPAKVKNIPAGMTSVEAWDAAVDEANRTYCKRMHNLFCDNCHSHVCRALQTMEYSVGVPRYLPTIVHPYCSACDRVALTASPPEDDFQSWRTALMLYHLVPLCTTGLDALQHGHARGWMFFRGKAGFLRPLTIHLRAVRDYRKLLVAGPSLTSTQGAARGPYCVRLHRFRE